MRARFGAAAAVVLLFSVLPTSSASATGAGSLNVREQQVAWVPALPVPPTGWVSLDAFPDGTAFAHRAQGSEELLVTSRDYGVQWETLPRTPTAGTARFAMATPSVGYVANAGGAVYRTTDGARTWSDLTAQLHTDDGGRTYWTDEDWLMVQSIATARRGDMALMAGGLGPNLADLRATIVTTTDAGATWDTYDFGVTGAVNDIDVLEDPTSSTGENGPVMALANVALQDGGVISQGDVVYGSRDGGSTWTPVFDCGETPCVDVALAGPDHFVITTWDGGYHVTVNGGQTFSSGRFENALATALNNADLAPAEAVDFATSEVGYAVTNSRGVWRTADGGRTWVHEPSSEDVFTVGFADVATFSPDEALVGGPDFVSRRVRLPE